MPSNKVLETKKQIVEAFKISRRIVAHESNWLLFSGMVEAGIHVLGGDAGILFMPHLTPYIEVGYGIGTHIFDVGAFAGFKNGEFDGFGFKFTFELFND